MGLVAAGGLTMNDMPLPPEPLRPEPARMEPETRRRTALVTGLRMVLSGAFLLAAVTKLRDPNGTLIAVYQYQILSWENSEWFALGLPWFEGVAGLGLWIRRTRLGAHLLAGLMLLIFMTALATALLRKLDISCGCFGSFASNKHMLVRIAEDILLLGICVSLFRRDVRYR
jgi:putative oxidoreductase